MNFLKRLIAEKITPRPVLTAFVVFILAFGIVAVLSFSFFHYDRDFFKGILVEAHGMLLDILVLGVFVLWLNKVGEKHLENKRYQEEIDDFRHWKSEEAAHRIAGSVRRLNNTGVVIDLHSCYLEKTNLLGANLLEADLREANLQRATLQGADLQEANLQEADLQEADLQRANLRGAYLLGANLQEADLREANLQRANLLGANLRGAYLRGAALEGATLQRANLQGANLRGADLQRANLLEADLQRANLQGANLRGAYLRGATLEGATLQGANLQEADLQEANLQEADLQEAINLTVGQLLSAESLDGTKLDTELERQLEERKAAAVKEKDATG